MSWLLEVLGELIDRLLGPSSTRECQVEEKHMEVVLEPTVRSAKVSFMVRSRRIVFKTTFSNWYIPDVYRTVYEVVGIASPENRGKLDPKLLVPVVYPLISNPLLKWSDYPHLYAINAYLDRSSAKTQLTEVRL